MAVTAASRKDRLALPPELATGARQAGAAPATLQPATAMAAGSKKPTASALTPPVPTVSADTPV